MDALNERMNAVARERLVRLDEYDRELSSRSYIKDGMTPEQEKSARDEITHNRDETYAEIEEAALALVLARTGRSRTTSWTSNKGQNGGWKKGRKSDLRRRAGVGPEAATSEPAQEMAVAIARYEKLQNLLLNMEKGNAKDLLAGEAQSLYEWIQRTTAHHGGSRRRTKRRRTKRRRTKKKRSKTRRRRRR